MDQCRLFHAFCFHVHFNVQVGSTWPNQFNSFFVLQHVAIITNKPLKLHFWTRRPENLRNGINTMHLLLSRDWRRKRILRKKMWKKNMWTKNKRSVEKKANIGNCSILLYLFILSIGPTYKLLGQIISSKVWKIYYTSLIHRQVLYVKLFYQ